ncbi:phosphatidate cytidylyltransferase [Sporohalobacter salinus]|uniref:phosphatidate cytidylyltransferase n=1 Tax=Sporohalobacter salinus TaxID=1494606 RepID=UPI0019603FA9|nr:phosphatidate cytidylyltransferase [Sporohalobacter salinus]MBM7623487.1 phosphatidate cytidylyltransferase [Sporohalobacter salinus]
MLNKRVGSAIIGILLLYFILNVGGWLFLTAVLLLTALGLNEFYELVAAKGITPNKVLGIFSGMFLLLMVYLSLKGIIVEFNLYLGIIAILYILLLSNLIKGDFKKSSSILDTAVTLLGIIYVGGLFLYLILIYNFNFAGVNIGKKLIWLPILVTWITDTLAYFTGLNFGRHKLAPNISPKKTIEGALGGLGGSILLVSLVGLWLPLDFLDLKDRIILGALLGIASQLGDLVESAFKRDAQIKDSGDLIPGHGGVLDRFDSLLFVLPITYYYFQFFS